MIEATNRERAVRSVRMRQIEAGTVWINHRTIAYSRRERGGSKRSGLGRLNGVSAIDGVIEYRTIIAGIDLAAR